jgi:hypothetical protein
MSGLVTLTLVDFVVLGGFLVTFGGITIKLGRILEKSQNSKYMPKEQCEVFREAVMNDLEDVRGLQSHTVDRIDRLYEHLIPESKRKELERNDNDVGEKGKKDDI